MKFEFNWPSGFKRRCLKMLTAGWTTDDRRTTDAGVTGILIAHLRAFGSGEPKSYTHQRETTLSSIDSFQLHPFSKW